MAAINPIWGEDFFTKFDLEGLVLACEDNLAAAGPAPSCHGCATILHNFKFSEQAGLSSS